MKSVFALAVLFLTSGVPAVQQSQDLGLPALHKVKAVTLAPSYSCRSKGEFSRGYEQTALFLSNYSHDRNSPDLLFNGACGAEDYFQGSTAGDDMSLIADVGTIRLEDVTAQQAFNLKRADSPNFYSKFVSSAKVELNHTYAVVVNKGNVRGLLLFTVRGYIPNKLVVVRYAVEEYQVLNVLAQSNGFDWGAKNQE